MRTRLFALLAGSALGLAVVVGGGAAEADRPSPVNAHRHYILKSDDTRVYIGPNFCEVNASAQGFAAFHHKVHLKDPGLIGVRSESC